MEEIMSRDFIPFPNDPVRQARYENSVRTLHNYDTKAGNTFVANSIRGVVFDGANTCSGGISGMFFFDDKIACPEGCSYWRNICDTFDSWWL